MQVGDIVSLVDNEENVYYAQIRGLLVDNYCEKSAFLTWLIPTQESPDPKDGFDAATYLIGNELKQLLYSIIQVLLLRPRRRLFSQIVLLRICNARSQQLLLGSHHTLPTT